MQTFCTTYKEIETAIMQNNTCIVLAKVRTWPVFWETSRRRYNMGTCSTLRYSFFSHPSFLLPKKKTNSITESSDAGGSDAEVNGSIGWHISSEIKVSALDHTRAVRMFSKTVSTNSGCEACTANVCGRDESLFWAVASVLNKAPRSQKLREPREDMEEPRVVDNRGKKYSACLSERTTFSGATICSGKNMLFSPEQKIEERMTYVVFQRVQGGRAGSGYLCW